MTTNRSLQNNEHKNRHHDRKSPRMATFLGRRSAMNNKNQLRAMLGTGWHLSELNTPGVLACAGRPTDGTVILVHEQPSNWAQVPNETTSHALLVYGTDGDDVEVLADGLSEITALRRWKRYMQNNPGPALEQSPDGRKTRRRRR
jgi:hypothetical protein